MEELEALWLPQHWLKPRPCYSCGLCPSNTYSALSPLTLSPRISATSSLDDVQAAAERHVCPQTLRERMCVAEKAASSSVELRMKGSAGHMETHCYLFISLQHSPGGNKALCAVNIRRHNT
ncbi:hypothetical protein SRHO_G00003630 [Serrasalmus rhombeus]